MDWFIKEFDSFLQMIDFYKQKDNVFCIELDSQSPKKFYGLQFNSFSFYFASDALCKLQVIVKDNLIAFLVDNYFVTFNVKEQKIQKFKLNATGDTLVSKNNIFVIIYETGFFLFNPKNSEHKCIEVLDLIYNWHFISDTKIQFEYENKTICSVDLVM